MRFATFTTVAASAGEATDSAGLLDNLRQQTILAEELGFEAIWLGEHTSPRSAWAISPIRYCWART